MAEIWDEEQLGPMPERCYGCGAGAEVGGDCRRHDPFFNAELNGVVYGPFSCSCLCDPANVEAAVDQ